MVVSGHSKYYKLFSGAFSHEGAIELCDLRPRLPYSGIFIWPLFDKKNFNFFILFVKKFSKFFGREKKVGKIFWKFFIAESDSGALKTPFKMSLKKFFFGGGGSPPPKKKFSGEGILKGVLRVPDPESARKNFLDPPPKKNNFLGGHLKWGFEGPWPRICKKIFLGPPPGNKVAHGHLGHVRP